MTSSYTQLFQENFRNFSPLSCLNLKKCDLEIRQLHFTNISVGPEFGRGVKRIGPLNFESDLAVRGIVCSRRNEDLLFTCILLDELKSCYWKPIHTQ